MYLIGYDIGSSSVKAALVDANTGKKVALTSYPPVEMEMTALKIGWAEQNPELWWEAVCKTTKTILAQTRVPADEIKAIGISYQMHGLVLVDRNHCVLRPSIIWCDSRAVAIGEKAYAGLGAQYCDTCLLNSPGNFTASKLKWVQENEPEVYEKIYKIMLPGDYIAMKLSGSISTTISGLSEGIFWDFQNGKISDQLLNHYKIDGQLIPEIVDTFSVQNVVSAQAAKITGLVEGTIIGYRAGDQPNNALSLGVFEPGEVAATGGTSGVMYGISDLMKSDPQARTNAFAHVNHHPNQIRIGQLLCINGAGSQYAWIKKNISERGWSYTDMEEKISTIGIGTDGLRILPFGNGAERFLGNRLIGAQINNLQFNRHTKIHLIRAALEGIAFSFVYGSKVFESLGINTHIVKVGNDNLFQSLIFSHTIATLLNCEIQMIETTGAIGAAKASGICIGTFNSLKEAIATSSPVKTYYPEKNHTLYQEAYERWENDLIKLIN
jgi:xylulokinase